MGKKFIHETAILGIGYRFLQGCIDSTELSKQGQVMLPDNIYIGPYSIIGFNVKIGNGVIIDAFCKVDPYATIGEDTLITYRATVASGAQIGNNCVIGGNVSEGVVIGNRCRTFGKLIHKHTDSTMSWDHHETPEPGVTLLDDSFVGHDATIIGGVTIGPRSYICSGAIITKDVPPLHIGHGTNQITHYSQWRGELSENPIFK